MAPRKRVTQKQPNGLSLFRAMGDFAGKTARGRMEAGRLFSLCVRASISKCYEFNLHAWADGKAGGAFFALPTLRGICEELIVLSYMRHLPKEERDVLFSKMMAHEVHTRLATQQAFFSAARPLQPVLRAQVSSAAIGTLEDEIRAVWRAYGWPRMDRGVLPPIRQIAEKQGGDILVTLYDYLYRLTSGTVHFSVGALLRTGWGDKPNCTFSVQHFNGYYGAFARTYGAFMFCVYFELFGRLLRPGKDVLKRVDAIRDEILSVVRWPEIVTFEEMNLPVPDAGLLINALSVVMQRESKSLLARPFKRRSGSRNSARAAQQPLAADGASRRR
jgi:hypothetical protein